MQVQMPWLLPIQDHPDGAWYSWEFLAPMSFQLASKGMRYFLIAKEWARRIKRDSVTLWFAYRDPATPFWVKALCVFIVAYALSPIDLIPDFIPVLGYLDDVVLLPGLIWLAVRFVPETVLSTSRKKGDAWLREQGKKPRSYWGAALVLSIWAMALYFVWRWFA